MSYAIPRRELRPIDAAARSGRFQLVLGGRGEFAVVRWDGPSADEGRWVFSSGLPLDFEPREYRP